ncbi:MAG: glycosyltransferase [Chitinivibrionales bacterium]|nr:glycosyltransferase [Chitinivibrionales bacterium]
MGGIGMNLIFFKSHTFLAREIENALGRRKDVQPVILSVPERIGKDAVDTVYEQIKSYLPAIVLSVNNAGYDFDGRLSDRLAADGAYQVNWDVDDPFYKTHYHGVRQPNMHNRLDFVTEASFVPRMNATGYHAHFLPLGVDPSLFNSQGAVDYTQDIAFVGNSSLEFLDTLVGGDIGREMEKAAPLIGRLKQVYYKNPRLDLRKYLLDNKKQWQDITNLEQEKFLFVILWIVGYFYRRDFIIAISNHYKNRFTCYGDAYWSRFLTQSPVSTDACYYDNLCRYYRSTKINLNINRIQIRTSFTNRMFDCKASGAFLLTEKRELNERFFTTDGPEQEIVEFNSLEQCKELIDYYLEHDDEREKIAAAGQEKVLRLHTYDCRIDLMLQISRETWGV